MVKWEKIMETEKRQFENMSEVDKFIYFLLLQYGSPYSWGKENPEGLAKQDQGCQNVAEVCRGNGAKRNDLGNRQTVARVGYRQRSIYRAVMRSGGVHHYFLLFPSINSYNFFVVFQFLIVIF
jgi:hypothetical protein